VSENGPSILSALKSDLGKDPVQASYTELQTVTREIDHVLARLKRWMTPRKVPTPGVFAAAYSEVRRVPLATGGMERPACLVVGSFNYPFSLSLLPAVGSLAGGNPTVIKPSEKCPATAELMEKLVGRYLDEGAVRVIQGDVPVITALLSQPWGLIFFTGSERVGKIVASSAARTLTPTVLELGGKAPCYVSSDCPTDLRSAADRIIWAKTLNCGQTCVAPDYVVVHERVKARLCREMKGSLDRMFGPDPRRSEYSRIVDESAAERLVEMIREVEEETTDNETGPATKIECGGSASCDPSSRYVPPTIVLDPPLTSRVMTEEIFGPILPVLTCRSEGEAVELINSIPGTPLNLCVFTSSAETYDRITRACPAAGAHRNDCIIGNGSPFLPFGGLGSSGYGNYHGERSFDAFTHEYFSLYKPCHWIWEFGGLRYHPYNGSTLFLKLNNAPAVPVLRRILLALPLVVLLLALIYVPALRPMGIAVSDRTADLLLWMAEHVRMVDAAQ